MKRLLTPAEMYRCDAAEMEHTPSRTLMERAARACADEMEKDFAPGSRVFVLCGAGNNGGDGLAMAKMLTEDGYPADICVVKDDRPAGEEWTYRYDAAKSSGIRFVSIEVLQTEHYTAAADALFGIGLTRTPVGKYAEAIEALNHAALPILAVDIHSGVSALDGAVPGPAVTAYKTVTMAHPQLGLYRFPGTLCAGEIITADIGITDAPLANDNPLYTVEDEDVTNLLPPRRPDGNKGTFGKVLIIAGKKNMSGAAYFSAKAAYRCGAGLVRILTPEDNRVILQTQLPEAIMTTYDGGNPDPALIMSCLDWADVTVLGPGIGTDENAEILVKTSLAACHSPLILDADALNVIAEKQYPLPENTPVIMTPHPGEFSRLTGKPVRTLLSDLIGEAREYAGKHHVILAAKDARTVITDGKMTYLNVSGSNALAKGGSGDVLTGIIAALLAQGAEPMTAAALGAFIHGRAGELAEKTWGERGVLASETADAAARYLHSLEH
ncbi:MAG: NAD(P)H-hydrate dehydratase [Clostridia bacterium]|nr:NAD(P)H-hydrate dehydratase [Clostridia bacterium]